jgi:anti-sigma B factor antagonist
LRYPGAIADNHDVYLARGDAMDGRGKPVFTTSIRQAGDVVVVTLSGELDMAGIEAFEESIDGAQGEIPIVVDLRPLKFIDSTGIRALMRAYVAGQDGRTTVSFVPGTGTVERVFQICGVDQLLAWVDAPDH